MKRKDFGATRTHRLQNWSQPVLILGAILALGGLLASALPSHSQPKAAALTAAELAKAELFGLEPDTWQDPPEAPRPGPTPIPLVVDYGQNNKVRVGEDGKLQDVHLRNYNGKLVGPTFRVKPSDTLRLSLLNRLPKPAQPAPPMDMDNCGVHEQLDVTNFHTHGLHISPSGISDDVLREIQPGGPNARPEPYAFAILPAGNPPGEKPIDHHPGTDWYHAHLHGSTAVQLASGMAGALIVEGDIDQIPAVARAKERIFVFQQLAFDKDGEIKSIEDLNGNFTGNNPPKTGPKKHTSINGVVKPLIVMRPGQVERWRMIDAGVFEVLDLSLRRKDNPSIVVPFHQIALDGITLARVKQAGQIELGPGYRADALVQAPLTPGITYELYKSKPSFNLLAFATEQESRLAGKPEILAEIKVETGTCTAPCSTAMLAPGTVLPAPFADIRSTTLPVKNVTFSFDAGKFKINNECFHHEHVLPEFRLKKGAVEEWHLHNTSGGPHPFHIHVNPFQMLNADGSPGEWRDTIIVPPGGELRMRTRIERFTGRFVLHCHILPHEDRGMMQLVEVSEP
ncbi:MAG: multicopper oxidase family protein [Thermoanaerobaculia bacterium]